MMTFDEAQLRVKALPKTPPPNDLLKLYALFKQGTLGDVSGERPGLLDFKGRAKWDAWAAVRGKSTEDAQAEYVAFVSELEQRAR